MAEKTKIYFLKSKATGTLYVCYYDIENINNIHDKNIIVYNNDDKSGTGHLTIPKQNINKLFDIIKTMEGESMTQKQLNHISGDIAETLYYKYNNYYNSVYFDFIIDAVKNTLKDLNITGGFLEAVPAIHKHIKENYI